MLVHRPYLVIFVNKMKPSHHFGSYFQMCVSQTIVMTMRLNAGAAATAATVVVYHSNNN